MADAARAQWSQVADARRQHFPKLAELMGISPDSGKPRPDERRSVLSLPAVAAWKPSDPAEGRRSCTTLAGTTPSRGRREGSVWLGQACRLSKDHERPPVASEAMIRGTMAPRVVRKAA